MNIDIISILDYNGSKNNTSEMLPYYLQHYTRSFPSAKINIYMSNFPDDYNGYEMYFLNNYNCNLNKLELDNTKEYYDYRLTKKVRNYLQKELDFKNNVWKNSEADWIIICDIDEILMITEEDLKKEDSDVIKFEGYHMKRFKKESRLFQLTYGYHDKDYNKPCVFRKNVNDLVFTMGQHDFYCSTNKVSKGLYKLLHFKKIHLESLYKNVDLELVRKDIQPEVDNSFIFRAYLRSNLTNIKKTEISDEGIWIDERLDEHHYTDYELCDQIVSFLKDEDSETIADFGCGTGQYVTYLREKGVQADGYDGNPRVNEYCEHCQVTDLSKPMNIKKYDWVMSFEVGEHIPKKFEDVFLSNIDNTNTKGIILTWAPIGTPGYGHINCQDQDYIKNKIIKLGYTFDEQTTQKLKDSCSIPWLIRSLMVLRKIK